MVEKRDETNEKRTDFLQSVLDMRDRKGSNYDESTIVGHSLSFLTDGYETSSGVMAYCFYQVNYFLNVYSTKPNNNNLLACC